jgi:nucleotidyltransferase substrate binding protein (TIGR01987 family)
MSDLDLSPLKKAFAATYKSHNLLGAVKDPDLQEALRDSCIKRFEFTFEVARKLMSRYLKVEYGKAPHELKPRNVFRLMEGYGFIQSWERWSNYAAKRNDTSHEYDEKKADEIINLLPVFIKDVEQLISKFDQESGEP